jgi:DNA invertase Pin-like site-specific DNA recombinase
MKRAALYTRVSTDAQREERGDRELKRHIAAGGHVLVKEYAIPE